MTTESAAILTWQERQQFDDSCPEYMKTDEPYMLAEIADLRAALAAPVVLVDRNAVLEEAARVCEDDEHEHEIGRFCAVAVRDLKSAAPASVPQPAVPQDGISGPLTDVQKQHAQSLYRTLHHLGPDAMADVVRYASVCGYVNGCKDFEQPAVQDAPSDEQIPVALFDGMAVYEEIMANDPHTPRPTADNIADVLDAVVRLIRKEQVAAPVSGEVVARPDLAKLQRYDQDEEGASTLGGSVLMIPDQLGEWVRVADVKSLLAATDQATGEKK